MCELTEANRFKEAEALLLESYEALKSAREPDELDYALSSIAQFYSMPEVVDREKAEHLFME